jgi:hypothetical protein
MCACRVDENANAVLCPEHLQQATSMAVLCVRMTESLAKGAETISELTRRYEAVTDAAQELTRTINIVLLGTQPDYGGVSMPPWLYNKLYAGQCALLEAILDKQIKGGG